MNTEEIIQKIHDKIDWKEFNYLIYKLTKLEDSGFNVLLFILEKFKYKNFPDKFCTVYKNETKTDKGEYSNISTIVKAGYFGFIAETRPYYLIVLEKDDKAIAIPDYLRHDIMNLLGDKFRLERNEIDKITIASNI